MNGTTIFDGERHEERARTRSPRLPHASYPDTSKSSSGELYYMHHQRSCAVDAGGTCAPSSGRSDDLGENSVVLMCLVRACIVLLAAMVCLCGLRAIVIAHVHVLPAMIEKVGSAVLQNEAYTDKFTIRTNACLRTLAHVFEFGSYSQPTLQDCSSSSTAVQRNMSHSRKVTCVASYRTLCIESLA